MNKIIIPKRMGVEELMLQGTSNFNSNPVYNNPNTKYIVLGLMVITSIGVGLYMVKQYQKTEKNGN